MMDRNELTLVIAFALAIAFLLGWIVRWLYARLAGTPRSAGLPADMRVAQAEEATLAAENNLADIEKAAAMRIHELEHERDSALHSLAVERNRNDELQHALRAQSGAPELP